MTPDKYYFMRTIESQLHRWRLDTAVDPEKIVQHIVSGSTFWSQVLPNGTTLVLARLYAPVVERQEVFLGNILLNDFLFKTLPRAIEQAELGHATLLLNDLESAYILWQGDGNLEAVQAAYHDALVQALPALFFGTENVELGVHGDIRSMLTFYKCNIEPFPTFIMPRAYLGRLLSEVGAWIRTLVGEEGGERLAEATHLPTSVVASWRINVVLSLLTFFYCRDGREMQSFHTFLVQAIEDGLFTEREIKAAFGLTEDQAFTKKVFNKQKSGDALDFEALAQAVEVLLQQADKAIITGDPETIAPYLGSEKMLPWEPKTLIDHVLNKVQLGPHAYTLDSQASSQLSQGPACRFCGANTAMIDEKNIIGGPGTGNRFNQSLKRDSARFCPRCALSSYLETKRLGMQFEGIFPIPKLYNVIFHYGDHTDWEIEAIQQQIDYVLAEVHSDKDADMLWKELQQLRDDIARQHSSTIEPIDWTQWVPSAMAVIAHLQQDVQADVIPLGSGDYRLLVFILPQLRPGANEGLEFVQQRFSHSRLAVTTLLGFLRQLCGCDGPYYFQSVPKLAPGKLDNQTFYIGGKAEQADDALRRYGLITEFARRVVPYRKGHSQLADWILLSEQVERDPLSVFSDILRKSPIRGGDHYRDYRYQRLSNDFVPGMSVVDSIEYLALFERLRMMQAEIQS